MDTIKAFLEADAKRTQGEWEHAPWDGNVMTATPTINGRQHVADTRKSTEGNKIKENAHFIALASTLAPAIRTMQERLEKLEAEYNSALADIEMAREAFQRVAKEDETPLFIATIDEWQPQRRAGLTPKEIAQQALSALDKYKGGV